MTTEQRVEKIRKIRIDSDVLFLLSVIDAQKALIEKADVIIAEDQGWHAEFAVESMPDWNAAKEASGLFGELDEKSPKEHK